MIAIYVMLWDVVICYSWIICNALWIDIWIISDWSFDRKCITLDSVEIKIDDVNWKSKAIIQLGPDTTKTLIHYDVLLLGINYSYISPP